MRFQGHINCIRWTTDGSKIVVGSQGNAIQIVDPLQGFLSQQYKEGKILHFFKLTRSGSMLCRK